MNLSQREKILAAGVGLILLLFIGNYIWGTISKGFSDKADEITRLTQQRDDQKLQITAGSIAKSKLNRLVSQSLPSNEEKARAQYLEWLINLADECELIDPLPKTEGDSVEKDLYQSFKFQLSGTGTIENATKLLHAFHAKDYLHRILRFDMQPLPNSKIPNQLKITLQSEVLALKNAKPDQPPPGNNAPRLEKSYEEYYNSIVGRNIFAPTNTPPAFEKSKLVSATLGIKMDVGLGAKDADPGQVIKYEFEGEPIKGMQLDPETGNLSWTAMELGDYKVAVRATDSGIPAKSSVQLISIKVQEPPPAVKKPKDFDVASQAFVSALIADGKGPQAWIRSKTENKTLYLRQGEQLKLGDIEGKVISIGTNFIEFETEGKRWTVGQDEPLSDAYKRGIED
ncbi:MAG: hypothetical protein ACK6AO_15365 [Planctomycetota bacterium]